ncbi:NAD(P)/FAD-dependent oxidoreductase [Fructobacillus sp. M1-13]|uniref:NAD(P)/FAD-dependent oxidoreductase n=1 Tax=Fructobacillus papyriferae TaxID=2713171 RepID=A0ABS5QSJ1_9LACO|nr:NAD(P)/FAD-dependent oxidoreductase [Fructobacillus papyriferae]MBS9334932.1 NAD(P)/FAD-dependent oxidoreductase [Fructobacillus papyriferae]MCD2159584.1 NAD(P)/FAD-dependent oxidoreductase [Fructobacillus papyriferae]
MDFSVLYIGSGQATWNGAVPLAKTGVKIGVIEESQYGGVCSNKGCNAKIILDKPLQLIDQIKALQGRGLDGVPDVNWEDLMAHKHELIVPQDQHGKDRLDNVGITTISGHAEFVDAHTVAVGKKTYTADKIVIASGMRPHRLDIPGAEHFDNSTDFLSLPHMPEHVTILGGGFVGIEFATIASAVGAKVDVITRGADILKQFPREYVASIKADLKQAGVRFIPDMAVQSAEKTSSGQITLNGPKGFVLTTDYVLDATGRVPNHDQLNLEAAGVKANAHGIEVNDYLQTNVPHIYAAGDAIDKTTPKLTPTAAFESRYLAAKFMGTNEGPIAYPAISEIVFTSPRIAQVGVHLDEAKANPDKYEVVSASYDGDWYRQVENEQRGQLALIFEKANQKLVGAAEKANAAEETINTIVPYVQMALTKEELNDFVYVFPSIAYTLQRRLPLV